MHVYNNMHNRNVTMNLYCTYYKYVPALFNIKVKELNKRNEGNWFASAKPATCLWYGGVPNQNPRSRRLASCPSGATKKRLGKAGGCQAGWF